MPISDNRAGHGRRRSTSRRPVAAVVLGVVLAACWAGPGLASASVLRIPFPKDDGTLTPYSFRLGYPLVTLVYDTLLWRDAGGVPQPWLARSVDTSADGRQVTVHLADGAKWQDGEPVTAADVAFTFRYVAAHPHPRFSPEVQDIDTVQATDQSTAVFTLRHPSLGFADQPLADLPILPAHLWRSLPAGKTFPDGLPVGSGPYKLTEYRPGELYRFTANPDYFRGAPSVGEIDVPIIATADATLQALQSGTADMVPASLPADVAASVQAAGTQVATGPSYLGTVLLMDVNRAPFDKPAVRQAVAKALDVRQIASAVGDAVPATTGYLHPASPWAPPDLAPATDVTAARAVLGAAGLPPIEVLAAQSDPVKSAAANQVVQALQRAGAQATVKLVSADDLSHAIGEDGSTPSFQAAIGSIPQLASYDPDFLAAVFGSDPGVPTVNATGYRSTDFDDLEAREAAAPDPAARRTAVAAVVNLIAADAPAVPLFFSNGAYGYRASAYGGWTFVKGTGILDKRSFLDAPAPSSTTAVPAPGPASTGSGGGGGVSPLGLLAIGFLGLAAVIGVLIVRRR